MSSPSPLKCFATFIFLFLRNSSSFLTRLISSKPQSSLFPSSSTSKVALPSTAYYEYPTRSSSHQSGSCSSCPDRFAAPASHHESSSARVLHRRTICVPSSKVLSFASSIPLLHQEQHASSSRPSWNSSFGLSGYPDLPSFNVPSLSAQGAVFLFPILLINAFSFGLLLVALVQVLRSQTHPRVP